MNENSGTFPDKRRQAVPLSDGRRALAVAAPGGALAPYAPVAEEAAEGGFDINDVLRVVYKWRWLIAGLTLAGVLAGVLLSMLMTPIYRGKAVLEINQEPTQILERQGDVEGRRGNEADHLQTQIGLLASRSLAERVARTLNLASNPLFADQEEAREARAAQAVANLQKNFDAELTRGSRLVTLNFDNPSPQTAANVVDAYASSFINSNLERRYEANSFARDFLQKRIVSTKGTLEKSERDLVGYATRNGIIVLGNGGEGSSEGGGQQSLDANSLVQLNSALSQARSDRIAAEQRYRNASSSSGRSEAINNPTVQALTGQRAALQAEYQEKLGIFQPEFPQMEQLRARINDLSRSISREQSQVSSAVSNNLQADFSAAVARENALQGRVNGLKSSVMNERRAGIQYGILQREVDTNRSLYDALLQRYKEIGVAGGVGTNLVSIVDRAEVPVSPIAPNLPLNVIVGLGLGLLLGLGTAFLIEYIDDTIKTPDDLTNKLGLTPLGVIPKAGKDVSLLEVLADPRAPITEAYLSVRTALQFSSDHGVPKTLLVSSTRAGEGKSSTSMALAQSLARLGASVLLIDSDLRKPTFRAPSSSVEGLSNLLAGADNTRACIHKTSIERLFLLPSGPIPPNPAELLSTDRFAKILGEVGGWFDYVVIDAPPVLGLADAPLLSSVCEGTLLVFEASQIRRGMALNAVNRMRASDANLVGGILTKFNAKQSGYGYGYAYVEDSYRYGYGIGEERQRQIELVA